MPCGMSCFSHACSSSTTHHMANATTSWLPARSRSTRADGPDAREEAHWNPRSESAASQFLYPCMLALVRAYSFSWTACRPSSSMLVELVHELNGSTCSPSVWANERKWLTGRLQSSSPSYLSSPFSSGHGRGQVGQAWVHRIIIGSHPRSISGRAHWLRQAHALSMSTPSC